MMIWKRSLPKFERYFVQVGSSPVHLCASLRKHSRTLLAWIMLLLLILVRLLSIAIIVHLGGNPCDLDEICDITDENNLLVIEDSALLILTERNIKEGTVGPLALLQPSVSTPPKY